MDLTWQVRPVLFLSSGWLSTLMHCPIFWYHLSILAHKLGRAVYYMLKNKEGFDMGRFLAA